MTITETGDDFVSPPVWSCYIFYQT